MKSSKKYMLDTNTVSYSFREHGDVARKLAKHHASVCISAITLAELRFGADKKKSRRIHGLIDTFVRTAAVVPFGAEAAAQFGRTAAALAEAGTPIGDFDAMIAAHALALDLTLVTNNVRHFKRVHGLRIEDWV